MGQMCLQQEDNKIAQDDWRWDENKASSNKWLKPQDLKSFKSIFGVRVIQIFVLKLISFH